MLQKILANVGPSTHGLFTEGTNFAATGKGALWALPPARVTVLNYVNIVAYIAICRLGLS